jgi:hypothetical protein
MVLCALERCAFLSCFGIPHPELKASAQCLGRFPETGYPEPLQGPGRRGAPADGGRPWALCWRFAVAYWICLMMSNIGMYSAMTAAPTQPPITAISSGSISDVRASTMASTSLS